MKKEMVVSIPYLLFYFLFMVYPIVNGFYLYSSGLPDALYGVLQSNLFIKSLKFSFEIALYATIISIVLGLIIAYYLANVKMPGKQLYQVLIMLPFIVPTIPLSIGISLLFGREGYITRLLRNYGIDIVLGSGLPGIVMINVIYGLPLAVLYTISVWRQSRATEEVTLVYGISGPKKFFKITLPQILPGMLSAALIIFLFSFISFESVLILGEGRYLTIETLIYFYYHVVRDPQKSMATAIYQMLISFVIIIFYTRYLAMVEAEKKSAIGEVTIIEREPKIYEIIFFSILTVLLFFMIFAPLGIVISTAFYDRRTGEFTLDVFKRIFSFSTDILLGTTIYRIIFNTIYYAMATMLIAVILASLVVFTKNKRLMETLLLLNLGVSPVILGVLYLMTFGLNPLYRESPWVFIIIAHSVIALPMSVRVLIAGMSKVDKELIDASKIYNIRGFTFYFKVFIPLMGPSFITAMAFAFATSIGEYGATYNLYSSQYATLPIAIYLYFRMRRFQFACGLSLIYIIISFIAFLFIYRYEPEKIEFLGY